MLIKIVKENGSVLHIGEDYKWRLQRKGSQGLSEFTADVSVTQDYSRDGAATDKIRLKDVVRILKICNVDMKKNAENRLAVQKFFNYNAKYKIYITHEGVSRWFEGTLTKMALPEPTNEDYLLKVTASFHCDSPYLNSVDDFGKDIADLVPYFAFPWISRMDVGTACGIFNFTRTVTLKNDGDNITYPLIYVRFKNSVTNPIVSINEGFIKIIGEFNEDDNIVIDYTVNPPRITNNEVNILGICDRASKFDDMYIMIGENTISYNADNGSEEMSVSVYYNRLYTTI